MQQLKKKNGDSMKISNNEVILMKFKILFHVLMIFLLAVFFSPQDVKGEERKSFVPVDTKRLHSGNR